MNEELGNAEKIVKVDMSKLVTELLVVEKENEEHANYITSSALTHKTFVYKQVDPLSVAILGNMMPLPEDE